jgi:hypothetical protein
MLRIFLLVFFCACSTLSADMVRVQPKVEFPIIDLNSMISWNSVRSECLPPTEKDPAERCRIQKLGNLGSIDDKKFYFVLYEWFNKNELEEYGKPEYKYPRTNSAVVLFYANQDSPNMLRPFYADRTDLNIGWFEEPKILRGPQGVLLKIPHRSTADANAEVDNILQWQNEGHWQMVDTQSWIEDLQNRLPTGCSVVGETLVNYEQMKASNYLWKPSDENCCPTCGRFSATLAFEEGRLVIKEIQHNLKARLK